MYILDLILNLSIAQVICVYIGIIVVNMAFSLLVKYLVNRKYKNTDSVDKAMYLQMILGKYVQIALMAISVFLTTIISMPYLESLGKFDFFGAMLLAYIVLIIISILNQTILYNTNKRLRKTTATRWDEIKTLIKIYIFTIIPMLIMICIIEYKPGSNILGEKFQKYFTVIVPAFVYIILSIVMPLFNKFLLKAKEFEDKEMNEELTSFIKQAGIQKFRLFLWPTKDNKHANALVSGLVRKDVFISDYLVDNFSLDEIKSVVAHEIGHIKKQHLWIRTGLVLGLFIVFPLLGEIMESFEENFYEIPIWVGILIFIVISVGYLGFLRHYINRIQERQADAFVLELGIEPRVYINALYKLSTLNNLVLKFNKLDEKLQTHPSTANRIRWIAEKAGINLDEE